MERAKLVMGWITWLDVPAWSISPGIVLVSLLLSGSRLHAQSLSRISVNSSQGQANAGSYYPWLSRDGLFVAFGSEATNLIPSDTNGISDVFLHNTWNGETARASVGSGGIQTNAGSYSPSVSDDGRFVTFYSYATNLAPDDSNGQPDVFLADRQTATTTRVSSNAAGFAGNGQSLYPTISGDGAFVAFISSASDLVPGDTGGWTDFFIYDRLGGTIERVSVDTAGAQGNGHSGSDFLVAALSSDGRYVAFTSTATNLVPGDTNASSDIFIRDRQSGTTFSPMVDPNWVIGNQPSSQPSLSADGRYLAFASLASNFVLNDTNSSQDIFVCDLQTGIFTRASVDTNGVQGNGSSAYPSISPDGRYVAYESVATNLVANDTNPFEDIFLHDLQTGSTLRVNSVFSEPNQTSHAPRVSEDGGFVAFYSYATNLVAGDTNGAPDVFLYEASPCDGHTFYCTAKVNSQGCVPEACASGIPSFSGLDNFYVTAHHVLNNKTGIFLWSPSQASVPLGGGTLCLASPIRRTPAQNSGGTPGVNDCTGSYSFFFSQSYMAAEGIAPGATIYGQYWSRDPFFAPPNNIGLTNGIQFTVAP